MDIEKVTDRGATVRLTLGEVDGITKALSEYGEGGLAEKFDDLRGRLGLFLGDCVEVENKGSDPQADEVAKKHADRQYLLGRALRRHSMPILPVLQSPVRYK